MDNFNALSKSAILTKLALDGYFIDLLTLNSFIEKWHIEAIYEDDFGIEFFDNNSYAAILDNLKDKYNETTQNSYTNTEKTSAKSAPSLEPATKEEEQRKEATAEELADGSVDDFSTLPQEEEHREHKEEQEETALAAEEMLETPAPEEQAEPELKPVNNYYEHSEKTDEISAEVPQEEASSAILEHLQENLQISEFDSEDDFTESIMPAVMGGLKPGPVTPQSTIHVDHNYVPKTPKAETLSQNDKTIHASELTDGIEENFTKEEIEKANKLMSGKKTAEPPTKEAAQETSKEEDGELDLMQLAQSFAKNLTKGIDEKTEPADLDKIFEESYTEGFENLQEFADAATGPYYDLPDVNDIKPLQIEVGKVQKTELTKVEPAKTYGQTGGNLSANDIREIIRDEMSRQTPNNSPAEQNGNIKEMITEIVQQTTEKMPQNAFKLDISNRTLELIAKAIAKKIAVQLNNYYKLNLTKQTQKLELIRGKALELKDKNQALVEENRRLKAQLVEKNRDLNCYKPTIFGLFKFEKTTKSKKR